MIYEAGSYDISVIYIPWDDDEDTLELATGTLTVISNDDDDEFYDCYFYDGIYCYGTQETLCSIEFYEPVTGTITLKINGTTYYNGPIEDNGIRFDSDIIDLTPQTVGYGKCKVELIYSGSDDNEYEPFHIWDDVEFTYSFSADMDESLEYGEDASINVNLPSNANGTLEYTINGKKYSIKVQELPSDRYGFEPITIKEADLRYGDNEFTMKYIGDDYPEQTLTKYFEYRSSVHISSYEANFDENIYVSITLPKDATGRLVVYRNNDDYDEDYDEDYYDEDDNDYLMIYDDSEIIASQDVRNGVANITLNINNVGLGYHEISIEYIGDDYSTYGWYGEYGDGGITFRPKSNIPAGIWAEADEYEVNMEFPSKYNGQLIVTVNGESKEYNVRNGKVSFNIPTDSPYYHEDEDDYNYYYLELELDYEDDDENYYYDEYEIILRNEKPEFELELDDGNDNSVLKGNRYYVYGKMPNYCDGIMNIYVDGVLHEVQDVYTYYEDDEYEEWIGVSTDNLTMGKHTVKFEYIDEYYKALNNVTKEFEVSYIQFEIPETVTLGEYYHGEGYVPKAYVEMFENATGNVRLTIDGVEMTTDEMDDGWCSFKLGNLTPGKHTIKLDYFGGNYPAASKTATTEAEYYYGFEVDDIAYGASENVRVFLPIGATGSVKLTIDGKTFTADIDKELGIAHFTVTGIKAGEYEVTVSYAGAGEYPAETQTSENVTVYYEAFDNVDDEHIFQGDLNKYNITLILPEDADGVLSIYEQTWEDDGEDEYQDTKFITSVELVNGKATISLKDIFNEYLGEKIGEFELLAVYEGEDYDVEEHCTYITINRDKVTVTPERDLVVGDNITYSFKLPEYIDGTLEIYRYTYDERGRIDRSSEEFIDIVEITNGKGNITIKNLPLGYYYFEITYTGDDYDFNYEDYVYVAPQDVTLANKVKDNGTIFTVTLPGKSSGVMTVKVSDGKNIKEIKVSYDNGVAVLDASTFDEGTYYLESYEINDETYGVLKSSLGDKEFKVKETKQNENTNTNDGGNTNSGSGESSNPTVNPPANPAPTPVKANKIKLTIAKFNVKKSAKKLVVKVTLKINGKKVKGKKVTLKFNGKTYKVKTAKNGVAKFTIKQNVLKKLKVGKKVKYQATYGKTTVKKSIKVKK